MLYPGEVEAAEQLCAIRETHRMRHYDQLIDLGQGLMRIATLPTPVAIDSLAKDEAHCTVCCDPFGIDQEEKAAETPIRLPCGHLFGND